MRTIKGKSVHYAFLWINLFFSLQVVHSKKPIIQLPAGVHRNTLLNKPFIISHNFRNDANSLNGNTDSTEILKCLDIRGGAKSKSQDQTYDEEEEDDYSPSIVSKVVSLFMDSINSIMSLLFPPTNDDELADEREIARTFKDFGSYLTHAYDITEEIDDEESQEESTITRI